MSEHALYGERADLYDAIYHWKDYPGEAERVAALLSELGVDEGARVLEAACGTGSFLAPLRDRYEVAGFDLNPAMLDVARGKLPGVDLFEADMRSFEVDEPYDALLCLFSSIGYLRDDADLRRTALRFAAAVRPGGAVILEPWIEREDFREGTPYLQTYEDDDLKLARASVSRVRDDFAVVDMKWVVARRDRPVETFDEVHELRFVPAARTIAIFADAGIRLRRHASGLIPDRGLLAGNRT
jgi:SAM-dependent methyltransferase